MQVGDLINYRRDGHNLFGLVIKKEKWTGVGNYIPTDGSITYCIQWNSTNEITFYNDQHDMDFIGHCRVVKRR